MSERIVVVGAGHGGVQLAFDLRRQSHDGEICLLSREADLPYQRPPLSKTMLKGNAQVAPTPLRPAAAFDKAGIDLRLGTTVTAIDRAGGVVESADGAHLPYDRLVLATGAGARPAPFAGTPPPAGVLALRALADARALHDALAKAGDVVIAGGGLIGLEIAAHAAGPGRRIAVVEAEERLMARTVSPDTAAYFESLHRHAGVDLRLGRRIEALETTGGAVASVALDDGAALVADLVISAIGAVPATGLAEAAGLAVADGIVVDEHLSTDDPAVFALGDCVRFPCIWTGDRVRLESVQNAIDQARSLAATLTGMPTPYTALPWFWSDQGATKLQIAGFHRAIDRWTVRGDPATGRFSVLGFADDRLRVVEAINRPKDYIDGRKLLAAGETPPDARVSDPDQRLL